MSVHGRAGRFAVGDHVDAAPLAHRVDDVGADDQAEVREGLREVADLAPERRVVLLGEEAEVVAQAQQPLEEALGLVEAPGEGVVVDEPEAADQKGRFVAGESVDAVSVA